MKSWIDTVMKHDNTWLVLVFHGVENLGWEPKTRNELVEYFSYMKANENQLWIATFRDVTKFLRARMNSEISTSIESDKKIQISLKSELDPAIYSIPLTLKTYLPSNWKNVELGNSGEKIEIKEDEKGKYISYNLQLGNSIEFNRVD
jgi:hypothetical protein